MGKAGRIQYAFVSTKVGGVLGVWGIFPKGLEHPECV
jgi:hypothetical protein